MTARSEKSRSFAPESGERPPPTRRTIVAGALVGVPVSAVLLILSLRHVDTDALAASIGGADLGTLVLAVCAMSLVYITQATRWYLVSASPIPLRRFGEWVLGAIAVNNVVPGRPGDLLRVEWLARRARMPRARALASVAVDRGLDFVALVSPLALTYPAVHHTSWLNRLCVLAWGSWALSAWLVTRSLGIELTPLEVVFVTAVLNLGVAIPSSPGFIGTYQWLGVSALGLLAVNQADAFAFSVLMHAAWFVPTTLVGAALALHKLPPVVAGVLPRRTSEHHAA